MNRNKKYIVFFLSLIVPALIVFLAPFGLNQGQSFILGAVILVVTWWGTKVVSNRISSAFLVIFFLIFSGAPVPTVLKFPLSDIFLLLVSATLISAGIIKSKLSTRISVFFLNKYGYSGLRLVALPFIIDLVLMFFIPQPFPRVILLAAIYMQFLKDKGLDKKTISVILFSIFTATTGTSMLFLNGDILLNNLVLEFAGISLTWLQWAIYMTIPSLITCGIMFLTFVLVFRKEIRSVQFNPAEETTNSSLSLNEKKAISILSLVIVLWMTEPFHGISTAIVSAGGVVMMLAWGLLKLSDAKKLNIDLLIFLTAAFSIGGVMGYTGTADVIFNYLLQFMPAHSSPLFFPFIITVSMILHMVIGSTVTTLAVALPGVIMMNGGVFNPAVIALVVYTAANIHYLLPFQHVIIMIGAGEDYYESSHVMKYGICLTLVVFISVLLIQLPWWRLLNLM